MAGAPDAAPRSGAPLPTCWYCPECGCGVDGDHANQFPEHSPEKRFVLVPGVDLPTLLRNAGYDVEESAVTTGVDETNDWISYCLTSDRRDGTRCLVVVLPDEKEAM